MIRRRVLVLGAEGMLGRMVFQVLSGNDGLEVLGTSRRRSERLLPFEVGRDDVGEMLESLGRVDAVVNAIAVLEADLRVGDPESAERATLVNAVFPHRLCEAARSAGVQVILVSTDAVFEPDAGRCVESTPPTAQDVYGGSKLRGEVRGEHVLNVRTSVIGPDPRRKRGLLEWVLNQRPGAHIRGFADQHWSGATTLQFARLCEGIITRNLFCSFRAESPVHHLCPNERITKFQMLLEICQCYRRDVRVTPEESGRPVLREFGSELRSIPALMGRELPLARALESLRDFQAVATGAPVA